MNKLCCLLVLLITACCIAQSVSASDAAYDAWMQNRPDEAVPLLFERAQSSGKWSDYYDLGLAAHDSGDDGLAIAWLLKAHLLAPAESAPREALQALNADIPTTWLGKLGPLAWPGTGIFGALIMLSSGLFIGLSAFCPKRRWLFIIASGACLVLALPGSIAHSLDAQRQLLACVRPGPLLDATGQPLQTLPAGTIVSAERQLANGRMLVQLSNGERGFLDKTYCDAKPAQ